MPHIFADLDNKRRYLGTLKQSKERFYLRILTTGESLRQHPKISELYTHIAEDMVADLDKTLQARKDGEKQKIDSLIHFNDETRKKEQEFFSKILDDENSQKINRTIAVIENEGGDPVSFIHFTFNDPELISRLKINDVSLNEKLQIPQERNFFFLDDAITIEDYKGKGFMSLVFDKVMTMIQKRCFNEETQSYPTLEACISMSAAKATKEDGEKMNHAINLPTYFNMLQGRALKGGKVILRDRAKIRHEGEHNSGYSFDAKHAEFYLNELKSINEEKISELLERSSEKAADETTKMKKDGLNVENKGVGAYISVVNEDANHQGLRELRATKREKNFEYKKLSKEGKGWQHQ